MNKDTIHLTPKEKREYNRLTKAEKKIYDSVKSNFPATSHDCAIGVAWQGGVRFQFIHK